MSADREADILADLTEEQRAAVTFGDGPLMVLAAAGSGKTRVITRRIAHLIQRGVKPWSILAITFTNKAAGEMRQRVERIIPGSRVFVSTFHAFGARFLREHGGRLNVERNFTIYDIPDRNKVVKDALELAGIDNAKFTPERIAGGISKAKNQLKTPEEYARTGSDFFTQTVARVYGFYQKRLRDANAVDFDDLLYLPALALRHDAELRAQADDRYRYILIDEYQDTNAAQYEIVRKLTADHPNVCIVGDPDQSIYKFRGSDIKNILNFERDFPDAAVITLGRNYRSTKAILHAADCVIANNVQRKKKPLVTDNGQGDPVNVMAFDTGLDEADLIVKDIRDRVEAGDAKYRDHAIFLRINALSRTLESAFVKHAVPFQIVRGLAFFDRKENRDVLAYLRVLVNPRDDVSFLRAVNEPARGVGKTTLQRLQDYAAPREVSLLQAAAQLEKIPEIKGKGKAGLREFARLMAGLQQYLEQPPDEVMRQVINKSGYRQALQDSRDEQDEERLANIEELVTAAGQFAAEDSERTIVDFLESVTLTNDQDGYDEQQDCVSVMTLHAAKGLEFPIVNVMALEQGLLPHERSLAKEDEVEEERRLFFVGMTRAMKKLTLSYGRTREFRGSVLYTVPSMFIEELPQDGVEAADRSKAHGRGSAADTFRASTTPASEAGWRDAGVITTGTELLKRQQARGGPNDYAVGESVEHEVYGRGKVTDVSGYGALRKMKVRFAAGGERTFVVSRVKLTKVE